MGVEELIGHEEKAGASRPQGVDHGNNVGRESWLVRREKHEKYIDGHEPEVIVVGAGQGGLTVAARLGMLGVDTLIVERNERVGDNWRKRYSFLGALRNSLLLGSVLILLLGSPPRPGLVRPLAVPALSTPLARLYAQGQARRLARDVRQESRDECLVRCHPRQVHV